MKEIGRPLSVVSNFNPAVFDSTYVGVWVVSLEGVTKYVNPSAARMLGYQQEEMLGHSFFEFMDEDARELSAVSLEKRKNGLATTRKVHLKSKTGTDIWVLVAAEPLRDINQNVIGSLAFITETEKLEHLEEDRWQLPEKKKSFRISNLKLDPQAFEAEINSRKFQLTRLRFKLLMYFAQNPNRVIERKELLENVWNEGNIDDHVINAHMVALRKKLRGFRGEIKTIYGLGYILKTDARKGSTT